MKIATAIFLVILIHELGHLAIARVLNVEVKKVCILMDYYFSIISFKIKETKYVLGWFPSGGYVEFAKDREKVWKQILILSSGVIANIAALIIFDKAQAATMVKSYIYSILNFERIQTGNSTGEWFILFSIIIIVLNLLPIGKTDGNKINKLTKKAWR